MAKGYWVVNLDVTDFDGYMAYAAFVTPFLEANGGRFLIRAGKQTATEGRPLPRTVVVEFASYDEALRVYDLPEYQTGLKQRTAASVGNFVIVEGFDGR